MSASEGNHAASHAAHDHGPPPPPEPKTPLWLPAIGAVLFLSVGVYWAICASDDLTKTYGSASKPTATAAASAKAAPPDDARFRVRH